MAGLSNVVEISAGQVQTLARTASGTVYGWGSNEEGQLCMGKAIRKVFAPVEVPLPGPASEISGGGNHLSDGHSLMLVEGVPYGCGDDESGQLGDGSIVTEYAPTVGSELLTLGLTRVVAAGEASIGLSSSGEVYTWGSNAFGDLGDGGETGFSIRRRRSKVARWKSRAPHGTCSTAWKCRRSRACSRTPAWWKAGRR